jgi:hypothetical protein
MLPGVRRYVMNLLIALDQLFNVILGGNPDETISSAVGRKAIEGRKWALIAEKVINALFWFDPNHCRSRVEWEEYLVTVVELDRVTG